MPLPAWQRSLILADALAVTMVAIAGCSRRDAQGFDAKDATPAFLGWPYERD